MAAYELPASHSPNLALLHPTPEEKIKTWQLNGASWRGTMPIATYLRRENHLENQAFTGHGGITFWILVDSTLPPNERPILGSCESFRKRALVARFGKLQEVVSHGIGSVFCDPKYRGRGYAQRMMEELGKKLETWNQEEGTMTDFTVLYSDIGKVCRKYWGSHFRNAVLMLTWALEILFQIWLGSFPLNPYCVAAHEQ